jgi:hypothetical protein
VEALALARTVLKVSASAQKETAEEEEVRFGLPAEPQTNFDVLYYQQILQEHVPELVRASGRDTLNLLCDLLQGAVRFSRTSGDDTDPKDYSYIWRPRIDNDADNYIDRLKNSLVSAIRDAALAIIDTEGKAVLDIVEKRPFRVFRRIGIYLRSRRCAVDTGGTAALITDPNLFDNFGLRYEYTRLLEACFAKLPEETQQMYFSLVKSGKTADTWLDHEEQVTGTRPSHQEGQRYVRSWQYKKIWPIRDQLSGEWQEYFEELSAEFGDLREEDLYPGSGPVLHVPLSPKSSGELGSMSASDLISFLKSWEPSSGAAGPSVDGLARELEATARQDPQRFAATAGDSQGLSARATNAILAGILSSDREIAFDWDPLLSLCLWSVEQTDEAADRDATGWFTDSRGWASVRDTVAEIISMGLSRGVREVPFDLQPKVWRIIDLLAGDPDPTPTYEAQLEATNRDFPTMSMNTTRGKAIHAVIRYALWVRRNTDGEVGKASESADTPELKPEVKQVLERHLDEKNDPSLAVRAVYGWHLGELAYLDKAWTTSMIPSIFPQGPGLVRLRDAAWDGYIRFCRPYDDLLDLLMEEYRRAVGALATVETDEMGSERLSTGLARHLVAYYCRGCLELTDESGLLPQFYAVAPDSVSRSVVDLIGEILIRQEEQVEENVISRLQALWNYRVRKLSEREPAEDKTELAAFGLWFASGKFEESWALTQLRTAIELAGMVEADHLVVQKLAEMVDLATVEVVRCLSAIIDSDKEGWNIHGWIEPARKILSVGMGSSDAEARQEAETVLQRLGARGYLEFRDLLPGE